jgi:hypothetical protein
MSTDKFLNLVEKFRVAYNSVDIPKLETLLAEDLRWGHHNKFKGTGRAGLILSIEEFARKLPGRYFEKPIRTAVNGQAVFVEQTWHATPLHSDPAWGWVAGVPTSMETCSVIVFENDMIIDWGDYG